MRPRPAAPTEVAAPAPVRRLLRRLRQRALRRSDELIGAIARLERAARGSGDFWSAYVAVRRAFRRSEPLAHVLAPVAASQFNAPAAEPGDLPQHVGLRTLGDALLSRPVDRAEARRVVRSLSGPAKVMRGEMAAARFDRRRVGIALSRFTFTWSLRLDGSAAEHADEQQADVVEGGRELLAISRELAKAAREVGEPCLRLESSARALRRFLESPSRGKLGALLSSGELAAGLRKAVAALGGPRLAPPFVPAFPTGRKRHLEPVSPATFPRALGAPPDIERAKLGAALFFDVRLSRTGTQSCATCHDVRLALSAGAQRPKDFSGRPVVRDVPGILNAAYDPMFFWDGRASTLADQVKIAVERDMGGRWPLIVQRLGADAGTAAAFTAAFGGGVTAERVQLAIQEFERTLVSADTPFDRHVRGESPGLSAQQLRGFDVFFGKARCSRCHRLPLLSGTKPPRFTTAEVASIGVPRAAGENVLDPDLGRGGVSGRTVDRNRFKIVGLRNLSETAPYFHNGAFATLEQVVDFYEKGSGPALGFSVPNFDPAAGEFELTVHERRALIAFLRDGLRDARFARKKQR